MTFAAQKQIPIKMTVISWFRRNSAISKNVFWPQLGTELSYFGQILCNDEKSHTDYSYMTKIAMLANWRW